MAFLHINENINQKTEEKPRRAAVINDISGAGKCSLTVMLPVLSALGCETSVLPTAVLSTHGGFKDPVYRDLTDDMLDTAKHWKREGAQFEGICSGYLGSREQIDIVREIFELFTDDGHRPLRLVDPVMGDNGELYGIFNKETAQSMFKLCEKADILTPNMTEAYCLLNEPYKEGPYDKKELERVMKALSELGPETVILTGAYTDDKQIGAACYDKNTGETALVLSDRVPGKYHGTGDIFAAVVLGAILNGKTVKEACGAAVRYTAKCIEETRKACGDDTIWGVKFEKYLPFLMNDVLCESKADE